MQMLIRFDGGCSPNPGRMYGSFSISLDGREISRVSRKEFGHGTNNTAEFSALIHALADALAKLEVASILPAGVQVSILTDSKILMNRIMRPNQNTPRRLAKLERQYGPRASEAAVRMEGLAEECRKPLRLFKSFRIQWQPRERNVENFGH